MKTIFRIIFLTALFTGCATKKVEPMDMTIPPMFDTNIVPTDLFKPRAQPPTPPGLSQFLLNAIPAPITVHPILMTPTIIWDTYTNTCASNLFVQGSDDLIFWINETQINPIWLTNQYKLTNTSSHHFYRLMVQ